MIEPLDLASIKRGIDRHGASLPAEIALRRDDPNAKAVLIKVAESDHITTAQLLIISELSFACRKRELGLIALERALSRMLAAEPRQYEEIADVLCQLIKKADSRQAAAPHFGTAMRLLNGHSDANAPFSTDMLQWLLAESWNRGVIAFKEHTYDEAENWMATAFTLSNYSPALAPWREQLNHNYQLCLKKLNRRGAVGGRKAADWKERLSRRQGANDQNPGHHTIDMHPDPSPCGVRSRDVQNRGGGRGGTTPAALTRGRQCSLGGAVVLEPLDSARAHRCLDRGKA